ncbi:DUF2977 domain-containing protein [Pediococcus pentosaceus]|uniref:DUF2977 domain-containing protein n=1 Tax=Pediococcus pentosaceus TaxID=1255 RepID=UPI001F201A22|nr:DUF2977 domain-containing protein [Pediococcus pentosaceus]WPK17311.1 DUF2977 domain-containing protein [Pediococcus pentosaceus]
MKLLLNEKNEILNYILLGDIDGTIEYDGEIPDDFEDSFKPTFYMLKDGEIVENPDYVEPSDTSPVNSTNSVQEAINKLGEATAKIADDDNQIKLALNKLGLAVADLQQTKEVK